MIIGNMTEGELMEWLRISRSTAVRWRKEGMPYMQVNRIVRYDRDLVQKWLDEKSKKEE